MKEANLSQTAAKLLWPRDSSRDGSMNWCTRHKIQCWSGLDPPAFGTLFHSSRMVPLLKQTLEAYSKMARAAFRGRWDSEFLKVAAFCEHFSTTASIRTRKNDSASMECLFMSPGQAGEASTTASLKLLATAIRS